MMTMDDLNIGGILIASIVAMFIGGIWYGPIMGKAWMEENKFSPEDIGDPKVTITKAVISNIILAFGIWVIVAHTGVDGWQHGAMIGGFLALFIHGASGFPNYVFENKPRKLFLIHMGNSFIGMTVMGAILGWY